MDYQALIDKYYPDDDELRRLLLRHSRQVADRSLLISRRHPELRLDETFLEEAAMLHDIGIRWCHAPSIYCNGEEPYICHGLIGGRLLREEGFARHAQVCERHTGTGLTREQIVRQKLPLPAQDFTPQEMEELSSWVSALPNVSGGRSGQDIPLHVSRFFPRYRFASRQPTAVETVYMLAETARRHLQYVYTGNC